MGGSTFGTIFRVTTWGESHGTSVGVVIDGCPAGLALDVSDIQAQLDRRKPGQSAFTTARKESDTVRILSGVFEGRTTGTPIALEVMNESQRSSDYTQIAGCYRPGHADYTYDRKYGFRDWRGGGRSSGRETIGRVAAGAVAGLILKELGIRVLAWTQSVGPVSCSLFDEKEIERNPLRMPDAEAAKKAGEYVQTLREEQDSSGGVIACRVTGVPAGLGEPVFDKLDALLGHALLSVGAVKGVEAGDGFAAALSRGSENNDAFIPGCAADSAENSGAGMDSSVQACGKGMHTAAETSGAEDSPVSAGQNCQMNIAKATNHAGGILGGISDGSDILLRVAVKPTPSIFREQDTVDKSGDPVKLAIKGRHDPLIMPRAVPVVESMVSLVLADALLMNMSSTMDKVRKVYC